MEKKIPNIALIVLDSLRYDVAIETDTPNLDAILQEAEAGPWRRAFAQGTYTLPATVSMLHAGFLPDDRASKEAIYNRSIGGAFRGKSDLHGGKEVLYEVPRGANLLHGFEKAGFSTYGVGGVGWFDTRTPTARIWRRYFQAYHWNEFFHEHNPHAFEQQIWRIKNDYRPPEEPYFFFLNVPSTHWPYCQDHKKAERTKEAQGRALQYVDQHLPELLALLPHSARPLHVFLCADHGDCMGEDGLVGHGFYHPKVMEVPLVHFVMGRAV